MPADKLDTFGGMVPAVADTLLPDRSAAHSENAWLYSGVLKGIASPELIRACTGGTAKVFRIPNNYVDAEHISDSTWMEFQDPDTDVTRALVLGDTFSRYYWAGPTHVPKYNTLARIKNGDPEFILGIPAPGQPGLAASGGTGVTESRSYLTTWVSAYGEEGPAGTPAITTGKVDDTWTLTFGAADPADLGTDRNLTHTNIYRTVTATDGTTTYFFVAQIPIGTLTYADTISDAIVSGNAGLESTDWVGPPTDLAGFIAMPNGILAGFRKNEIWFCEPYRPHAWPAEYAIVVDYPIVGLGVTNQTLIVCTQAYPVMVSGIHPSSMAQSKSASLEPCLARGSILSTTEGVYYASPNGLVLAAMGSIACITTDLITKDKWQSLVTVPSLRAARMGSAYFAFGSSQPGMFDPDSYDTSSFAQQDFTGSYAGVLIDASNGRVGFNLMSDTEPMTMVQNDPWSGEVFLIQNDTLYRVNLSDDAPIRRVYKWRSKKFQMPRPMNIGAVKLFWDVPAGGVAATGAAPATPAKVEFPRLPVGSTYGVIRFYADGALVGTKNLLKSGDLIRPPSGFKANFWQLELETYVEVSSIQFGSSTKVLAGV